MAASRVATVSVPVDVYVVVLVPSLTVMLPSAGIPRVKSEVAGVSGTVPVPVAAEPVEAELAELEEVEELDELDVEDVEDGDAVDPLDDDVVELPETDWSALCTAAVSSVLTRFRAVWLAMLAKPLDKLVSAEPITDMTLSLSVSD